MSRPTRTISIDPDDPDPAALSQAVEVLRAGGLVAFATETVYGLGADATNPEAVAAIYEAKGRPAINPLIVHVATREMAGRYVEWSEPAEALARAFWPGPLTMVLPSVGGIPDIVTAGLNTVAVRIPASEVAWHLIHRTDRPIAAPSANRSTGVSPTLAKHVQADLDGRVDLVLDSGQTDLGLESTVVDMTTREPRVLRPGPISAGQLEHALGGLRVRDCGHPEVAHRPASPGQSAVHYAPTTPAVRVDSMADLARLSWPESAALILVGPHTPTPIPGMLARAVEGHRHRYDLATPEAAAKDLYIVLRESDALKVDLIVIVPPPDLPEWRAVRDRLWRATRPADLA